MTMVQVKYPEIVVNLTHCDGNAFAIIGMVRSQLCKHIGLVADAEFAAAVKRCEDYKQLLDLVHRTVTVEA